MVGKQGVFAAVVSIALASGAPARADTIYEAPASCPTEAELRDAIGSRLDAGAGAVPEFRLIVAAAPTHYVGELEMDGEFRRSLVAPSCEDIVDGAALIIVLRVAEREAESRLRREEAPPQVAVHSGTNVPAALEPAPLLPAAPRSTAAAARRDAVGRPSYSFSTGGGVWGGVAPKLVWGPVMALGLRMRGRLPWSLRLGAERGASGTVQTQPAAMWTRLTTGSLTACAFPLGRVLRLETCLQGRVGAFEAGGVAESPIVRTERVLQPWVSLGPTLRAEMLIVPHLRLAWELAAPIPIIRERLVFRQPEVLVHETSRVVAGLHVSLEWTSDAGPK